MYLTGAPRPAAVCASHRLHRAVRTYRRFHQCAPPSLLRVQFPRLAPEVLVDLGELKAVVYRSDRGRRGSPATYIHFMEDPPRLACDPDGRQLYVVGGSYRVTRRGIEG